jgi:dihydrofolate reductase
MSSIVAGMPISLDGFVHDARGSTGQRSTPISPTGGTRNAAERASQPPDVVLMGRKTFEIAGDPDCYADQYEYQVPIFVVTRHPPAAAAAWRPTAFRESKEDRARADQR